MTDFTAIKWLDTIGHLWFDQWSLLECVNLLMPAIIICSLNIFIDLVFNSWDCHIALSHVMILYSFTTVISSDTWSKVSRISFVHGWRLLVNWWTVNTGNNNSRIQTSTSWPLFFVLRRFSPALQTTLFWNGRLDFSIDSGVPCIWIFYHNSLRSNGILSNLIANSVTSWSFHNPTRFSPIDRHRIHHVF